MKYMNAKKKYQSLNLQLFAGEGGAGDNGDDSGDDDDPDDPEDDPDGDGDGDPDEKKFSQKDVDDAVKKRVARERRKWQRNQQKQKPDGAGSAGDNDNGESEDSKAQKEAEAKASSLEVKVACFEADVAKDAVADVAALARAYMEADEDLDLEDAIEKVVKKYPHFKKGAADPYDDENKGKSWGQRQSGKGTKKMSGVEEKFYELNPDLKK